ncbi:Small subunit processome component [Phytophthora boehmeriae]|uniref:Small subunit processome component n=1 Tax=Phytophthora boehmeriae TaxID=109152 RepID=A0A8T1XDL9_9STRA|nr:Small subunit processome component [Phytophthora boehmeriae]
MCIQMKVDINERVPKYLQVKPHECEFFVPRAALEELEMLGEATREAYDVAKTFKIAEPYDQQDEDGDKTSVDVSKTIQAIIGDKNERKFVVCTQEVELRKALRSVPGVPLLYLNRSVLVFEEISRATLAIVRKEEKANMSKLDVNEKRKLEQIQDGDRDGDSQEHQRLTKKRAKGPNPLSMKKPIKKKVRAKKKKN